MQFLFLLELNLRCVHVQFILRLAQKLEMTFQDTVTVEIPQPLFDLVHFMCCVEKSVFQVFGFVQLRNCISMCVYVFRSLEHFWSLIGMRLYTCIDLVRLWNISKGRSRSINFIFRNGWFHSTFAGPFFKYRYFYFCVKNMFRLFFFHFDFEW